MQSTGNQVAQTLGTELSGNRIREEAVRAARSCGWIAGRKRSSKLRETYRRVLQSFSRLERQLYTLETPEPPESLRALYENLRLIRADTHDLRETVRVLSKLPKCKASGDEAVPRSLVFANAFLDATDNKIDEPRFSAFIAATEEIEPLRIAELWGMFPALKLVVLQRLTAQGLAALEAFQERKTPPSNEIISLIQSLRLIGEVDWKETLEQLSIVHRTLCLDPGGVYPRMDYESRAAYREAVEKIAANSDVSEIDVARKSVNRAQSAVIPPNSPEALRARLRHVGYYLLDRNGSRDFLDEVGYRRPLSASLERTFREYPDEVYIIGIEAVTLITVVALLMSLVRSHSGFGLILSALLLILPATQAAVELMNYLVTTVLTPRRLPKIDLSRSVDATAATIVAIPTLLINEKQIRQLVEDLEIRYLVNRDPNIFYALLTDLPDSPEPAQEDDPRLELTRTLISDLNKQYGAEPYGGFYLFHRHRIYNPREGAWMGWERKRGKLLDLNQLLRNAYDPFPVKVGDMSRLRNIKYVLTLDSDTQLPRGSAQRLIGTIAHPLNQPLIDPELNIVTEGYGILQPRVGISVHSASRSRLARIYSGETGFDIYSRAVSDVYQDLYEEGIFTGKGIYDVDALRQVLEHRFPRNALLSHDLIEGAYARAGLVSDVEVIDDYPSHYSAYNRRKHRWLRGDWQIARWVRANVPNESRRLVRNPISLVSKWKIVDNLRRSLIEPSTFLLLIAGWFWLPGGPRFWTLVTVALLMLPICFRLLFSLIRAAWNQNGMAARQSFNDFGSSIISILFNIAFLAHQSLVAMDAVIRTVVRSTITHTRLLEWETATEAELGIRKRTPVDTYLDFMPLVAIVLALPLWVRHAAAPYAAPFLIAWFCSKQLSNWLNRSPHESAELSNKEQLFLRELSLRTWRYFAEFSNEKNHWLIPDNVQERPYRLAERLSPTNLGFLLNARQAALEFGYLTITEFVHQTEQTLETALKLPRFGGHFLNWYDNIKLAPLEPRFVSSVDSGNLCASLWSLKQHCEELLSQPIICQSAASGLADHYRMVLRIDRVRDDNFEQLVLAKHVGDWLPELMRTPVTAQPTPAISDTKEHVWWSGELRARAEAIRRDTREYMPWFQPEYEPILKLIKDMPAPASATPFYARLDNALPASGLDEHRLSQFRQLLSASRERMAALARRLEGIIEMCDRLVREMDFEMLVDKRRNLLSVGYDLATGELSKSCYDLLASESRTAAFVAIAKGEAYQETWFRLGRAHTICQGQISLLSWTGTMFEYLMPVIWMRSHPNTLLERSMRSAVRAQQGYATEQRIPWGISEAAYSKTDEEGNYQYAAFGVPGLALNVTRAGALVVSPYSSALALMVEPKSAVANLSFLSRKGWLTEYGFLESADFNVQPARRFSRRRYVLVRCWMAHHQGMTLTAICNLLQKSAFQRWFHAEPLVQASELMLQERPLRARPITDSQPRRVLSFGRNRPSILAGKAKAS